MAFLKFYHSTPAGNTELPRLEKTLENIKARIGWANCIAVDAHSAAFSGSIDAPELLLELFVQKYDGKKYLYASLDNEVSWQEWDFSSQSDFESAICEHLIPRINRTIKTVTEYKKHQSLTISTYFLDHGKWVLLESDFSDAPQIRPFITKNEIMESVKCYQLK